MISARLTMIVMFFGTSVNGQEPATVHISSDNAQLHFGTNSQCQLQLMSGSSSFLKTTCPIIEEGMNMSLAAEMTELKTENAELKNEVATLKGQMSMVLRAMSPARPPPSLPPPARPPPSLPPPFYPPALPRLPAGFMTTVAGFASGTTGGFVDGIGTSARFQWLQQCAVTPDMRTLYIADCGNAALRKLDLETDEVTTVATVNNGCPHGVALAPDADTDSGTAYMCDGSSRIASIDLSTGVSSTLVSSLSRCYHLAADATNLYVASESGVVKINLDTQETSTLTLDAALNAVYGLALNHDHSHLYVSDYAKHVVVSVELASSHVSTVAGHPGTAGSSDGVGTSARFRNPWALALSQDGALLYVSDAGNDLIRQIDLSSGRVTTIAGRLNIAGFANGDFGSNTVSFPRGLAATNHALYISDERTQRIRELGL